MEEFIKMAASELGVGGDVAKKATSSILGMLQQQADPADMASLREKVPGLGDLLNAGGDAGSAGGALGGLNALASNLLGDKAGGLLKGVSSLSGIGLDAEKIGPMVSLLFSFLKGKAGGDLIGRLLGKVPELAQMVKG